MNRRVILLAGLILVVSVKAQTATTNFREDFQGITQANWWGNGTLSEGADGPGDMAHWEQGDGGHLHFQSAGAEAFEGDYDAAGVKYLIVDLRHGGAGEDVVLRVMLWNHSSNDVSASNIKITLTAADTDWQTYAIPIDTDSMTWVLGAGNNYQTDAEPRQNVSMISIRHNPEQTGPGYSAETSGSFLVDNLQLSTTPSRAPVTDAQSLNVLVMRLPNSNSGYQSIRYEDELRRILAHSMSYWKSNTRSVTSNADSLLELYHVPSFKTNSLDRIPGFYNYVVFADNGEFAHASPELMFEGVMQVSNYFLMRGARPMLLTGAFADGDVYAMGEHAYRVANGCGVNVVPASYALNDLGLINPSTDFDRARFRYLVAAMVFYQITGQNAFVESTYEPFHQSTVLDAEALCAAAIQTVDERLRTEQYTGSRTLIGGVQYRPFDPGQEPLNSNVRYLYKGTSTENSISSALSAILQSNGYTSLPNHIGTTTGGTKNWVADDTTQAQSYLQAYPNQILLAYARGAWEEAQNLINVSQNNIMPTVFDRHFDDIGSGAASILNIMDDVHSRSNSMAQTNNSLGWNYVPFHIGASRLYQEEPTVVASTDGVHVTAPFNNLIASMMLTSVTGDSLNPTDAILNDAQSLAGFNIGKQLIKQLALISETGEHIPDSSLRITSSTLPICIKGTPYHFQLGVEGGTPPYNWNLVLDTELPAGLKLSPDGLISGSTTSTATVYYAVGRVKDASGAFRKVPLILDLRSRLFFQTDGTSDAVLLGTTEQFVIEGADATPVTAVAPEGYHFVRWTDDGVNNTTSNPLQLLNVTESTTYTAEFSINQYSVTFQTDGTTGSYLTGSTSQLVIHGENAAAVMAHAPDGYHFVRWTESGLNYTTEDPLHVLNVMTTMTLTAHFFPDQAAYQLKYVAGTHGSLIGATTQTVAHDGEGSPVTVIPDTGYHFAYWSDGETDNPRTDTSVLADLWTTAVFALNQYTLAYTADSDGWIDGITPQTVLHGEDGSTITAIADTGYHFTAWSDGSTINPRIDTGVTTDLAVHAAFAINQYSVLFDTDGTTGAALTGELAQWVNHGDDCTTVTAIAPEDHYLANWLLEGKNYSADNPLMVEDVTSTMILTAKFLRNPREVTFQAGMGGSIVGAAIQTVPFGGNSNHVRAQPDEGYHFVQWDDGHTHAMRNLTNVTTDTTLTATFAINSYTVTFQIDGISSSVLEGETVQFVEHGSSCTAVNAVSLSDDFDFSHWTREGQYTDSFYSTTNPLVVKHVNTTMTLNAIFDYNKFQWTWVDGENSGSPTAHYGTQGVPVSANIPGGREGCTSWTDKDGNFWIFGGTNYEDQTWQYRNDLWKYDPKTRIWTWMKGSSTGTPDGEYGQIGISASNNTPGGRAYSASWTDQNGCLWLFGGLNDMGRYNDLWKFDPAINQWAWMHGSTSVNQSGTYGTQGTPAAANTPGARYNTATWTDQAGDLWLFGGSTVGSMSSVGYHNDLWRYSLSMGNWTWIDGASHIDQGGTYGQLGIADPANVPGARASAFSWTGPKGNFWLFGGHAFTDGGTDLVRINDMWKFDPQSSQWTWIRGSKDRGEEGHYGIPGQTANDNTPGGRESGMTWVDSQGHLWLFGGWGNDADGAWGWLQDLWRYDPSSDTWAWMKGSHTKETYHGYYGTLGVPSAGNKPGARTEAAAWIDAHDQLWLFGGVGFTETESGRLNDLWRGGVPHVVSFHTDGTPGASLSGETTQHIMHGNDCSSVEALAPAGQHFVSWKLGESTYATTNPITLLNVMESTTLTAVFFVDQAEYQLTYTASENGTLTGATSQIILHGEDGAPVVAVPNPGYYFIQWSDGVKDNPRIDTQVLTDITVSAVFADTEVQPEQIYRYLLGIDNDPIHLDINNDGIIDIADLILLQAK